MKNLLTALLVQFIMLIDSNGLLHISSNIRLRGCNSIISSSKAMMTAKGTTTTTATTATTATASTSTDSQEFQLLTGVHDIVDRYDTFLLDMWGVMHDGTTTYDGVLQVVQKLKELGKDLIILSNSSKRQDNSIKLLTKLGFDPKSDFSQIITSGEVSYHLLSGTRPDQSPLAPHPWKVLEKVVQQSDASTKTKKVFCFGSGDGDEDYLESCGWTLAPMDEADLIVARGTFTIKDGSTLVHKKHDGEEAYYQAYHEQLTKGAQRKVPMLVANPDKIRPDANRSPMPGTIGTVYEEKLREVGDLSDPSEIVKYIGKPFADVYEIALRGKDKSKVCMIGDALETDVAGGSAVGIDTIWVVKNGIHNVDIERLGNGSLQTGCSAVLTSFNQISDQTYAQGRKLMPTVVLPAFAW